MLGETIRAAQAASDPDTEDTYYHHWLVTLEQMVAKKAVTTRADLTSHRDAWERVAARTPHGQPIELRTGDFGGSREGSPTPSSKNGVRSVTCRRCSVRLFAPPRRFGLGVAVRGKFDI
jgi:hypothetical protein